MKAFYLAAVTLGATTIMMSAAHAAKEDSARGQRSFEACAACHSLQPDRNMTGPSLAGLWDRKAGTLPSFSRYSPALKSSGIVWTDATLDKWLADPQQLVPANTMTFPGIQDVRVRADLLAFLKDATQPGHAPPSTAEQGRSPARAPWQNQDPIVDADGSSRYVGDFSRRNHKRLIFAQH